ncbi:Protein NRD1 [Yarrowia sp. B02]|nr:Protein NRD1 [Yarrowia sp. B02]
MSSAVETEFEALLASMLVAKAPGVSGSKINGIRDLAMKNVDMESTLIPLLERHLSKTPLSHKLGAMYVLDAVARAYQEENKKVGHALNPQAPEGSYAKGLFRISEFVEKAARESVDHTSSDDTRDKLDKLVEIWQKAGTFPPGSMQRMRGVFSMSKTPEHSPPSQLLDLVSQGQPPVAAPAANNAAAALAAVLGGAPAAPAAPAVPTDTASILQALASMNAGSGAPAPAPAANPNAAADVLKMIMAQSGGGAPTMPGADVSQAWNLPSRDTRDPRDNFRDRSREFRDRDPRDRDPRDRDFGRDRNYRDRSGDRNDFGRGGDRDREFGRGGRNRQPPGTDTFEDDAPPPTEKKVSYDNSLPQGTIKVLSRTIFIGGVTMSTTNEELLSILRPYGRTQSLVMHRERKHAFCKMYTRAEAEAVLQNFTRLNQQGSITLRARWGVGFGPRDCSNYQTGISIIPIGTLTEADMKWVVTAPYGGTGGVPVAPGMVIEEPDIEVGTGVSSKAKSKRMPTNAGGRNGPRSSFPDRDGGFERDGGRDGGRGGYGGDRGGYGGGYGGGNYSGNANHTPVGVRSPAPAPQVNATQMDANAALAALFPNGIPSMGGFPPQQ